MLRSSAAHPDTNPQGQGLMVASVESSRNSASPSVPASASSAAATASLMRAADAAAAAAVKEQQLVLPPGMLPMALMPATAIAKDFGCYGATVVAATDKAADGLRPTMAAGVPASLGGAGYASVPAELCLGLSVLPPGAARLAFVSSLPWQQLLIPIGPGGVVASCSSGVTSTGIGDDARCLATLPMYYQASPLQQQQQQTVQPIQQQQLKQQTVQPIQQQRKSHHREQELRQLVHQGGLPMTSAPAALQLLATPSGQLFAAPVATAAVHPAGIGGFSGSQQQQYVVAPTAAASAAGMQPWALAQLSLQPTAATAGVAAQPAAAALQPLPIFVGGGSVVGLTGATSGSSSLSAATATLLCQPQLPVQMQLHHVAEKPQASGSRQVGGSRNCGQQMTAASGGCIGTEHLFSRSDCTASGGGCAEAMCTTDTAVSGDANFASQLLNGLIHILPMPATSVGQSDAATVEAVVPQSAVIAASSQTMTSTDSHKVDPDPLQQPAGTVAVDDREGKNYEPLPSIQTLARHCVAVPSSSSAACVAASVATAQQSSSRVVVTGSSAVQLPLSAVASTDLAGLLPGKYQLYATSPLLPSLVSTGILPPPEFQLRGGGIAVSCSGAVPTSAVPGGESTTTRTAVCQTASASSSSVARDLGCGAAGDRGCTTAGSCLSILTDGSLAVSGVEDIREFARQFKLRRLSLGLTQTQVGQALSGTAADGPAYSQSAICRVVQHGVAQSEEIVDNSLSSVASPRFEKLDITPKSAHKIKPVLEQWLREAEERHLVCGDSTPAAGPLTGVGLPVAGYSISGSTSPSTEEVATTSAADELQPVGAALAATRKRKRRTSFTPFAVDALNEYFRKNTHPSGAEMTELANQLKYDREVVRVWFCNKRQAMRNSSNRLRLSAAGMRSRGVVAAAPDTASSPATVAAVAADVVPASGVENQCDDVSVCAVGSSTTPYC